MKIQADSIEEFFTNCDEREPEGQAIRRGGPGQERAWRDRAATSTWCNSAGPR